MIEGDRSTSARVLRGGSWNNNPLNCRSAYRNNNHPTNRNNNVGFRVAKAHSVWPARFEVCVRRFMDRRREAGSMAISRL
jgi:hypothetical protein